MVHFVKKKTKTILYNSGLLIINNPEILTLVVH